MKFRFLFRILSILTASVPFILGQSCRHATKPYSGADKPFASPESGQTNPPMVTTSPTPIGGNTQPKVLTCSDVQKYFSSTRFSNISTGMTIPRDCRVAAESMTVAALLQMEAGSSLSITGNLYISDQGQLKTLGTVDSSVQIEFVSDCPKISGAVGATLNAEYTTFKGDPAKTCSVYSSFPFMDSKLSGLLKSVKFEDLLVPIFDLTNQPRFQISGYQMNRVQSLALVSSENLNLLESLKPFPKQSIATVKFDFSKKSNVQLANNGLSYLITSPVTIESQDSAGASLTIDAGVKVFFTSSAGIDIGGLSSKKGSLIVNGTASEPVEFTHILRQAGLTPQLKDYWGGIEISKWGLAVTINHLKMSYASTDYSKTSTKCSDSFTGGCIQLNCAENASLTRSLQITNSTLENCFHAGLNVSDFSSIPQCGYASINITNNTWGANSYHGLECDGFQGYCPTSGNITAAGTLCP